MTIDSFHPTSLCRIAKVELSSSGLGLKWKVIGLFWGAKVEPLYWWLKTEDPEEDEFEGREDVWNVTSRR
ncbi:hypothetical protein Tco_0632949 [Tanacetum coccineum]